MTILSSYALAFFGLGIGIALAINGFPIGGCLASWTAAKLFLPK